MQWKDEGAGDLLFGGLPSFFQGLEPRIGSPDPKVFKDMVADHCARNDAQVEFKPGNYSEVTTSEVEWWLGKKSSCVCRPVCRN